MCCACGGGTTWESPLAWELIDDLKRATRKYGGFYVGLVILIIFMLVIFLLIWCCSCLCCKCCICYEWFHEEKPKEIEMQDLPPAEAQEAQEPVNI